MESYSIEDIELLRRKSGLSYQEAVALLDYHNGSLARALIDLEKSGRLKEDDGREETGSWEKKTAGNNHNEVGGKFMMILQKLYRNRIKIQKDNTTVLNLSVLFGAACLLFAPHLTVFGIILAMILGYKFAFSSMDTAFSSETIEKMVRNAAQNAKSSVSNVVQNFKGDMKENSRKREAPLQKESAGSNEKKEAVPQPAPQAAESREGEDPAAALKKQAQEIESSLDSFFESNPAATTFRSAYSAAASSVPTLQVPVQAEAREGTVEMENDPEGFASVTIG